MPTNGNHFLLSCGSWVRIPADSQNIKALKIRLLEVLYNLKLSGFRAKIGVK